MEPPRPAIAWRRERELRDRARELRIWQTGAEKVMWQHVRAGKAGGFRFRRQFTIGEFIVDFCCFQEKLIIELDGDYHEEPEAKSYDEWRQSKLEADGWTVVRFKNEEVLADPGEIRARIIEILGQASSRRPSPPAPLPGGEGFLNPPPSGEGRVGDVCR